MHKISIQQIVKLLNANSLYLHTIIRKPNIFDNIMIMMEKYTYNLEGLVQERTDQLVEEKKKTEALLHRVLPK